MTERDMTTKKTEPLKLNMETIGNQQKNHKEETTMKKRTMLMMAMMVMAFVLTACSNGQQQQQAVTTTTPAPTQVAEVKPTEAPVATEAPAPTEEPTPTEAPTPTESQYMVDGYDFAEFYESGAKVEEIVQDWTDDSVRVIVKAWGKKIIAVLEDGDSFVMEEAVGGSHFSFDMYVPRKANGVTTTVDKSFLRLHKNDRENTEKLPFYFGIDDDATGTDVECPITITYEDGTEETITIYITKEYVTD